MLRLLQYLIFGHIHEWETVETLDFKYADWIGEGNCERKLLRCRKCGNWKKRDLR